MFDVNKASKRTDKLFSSLSLIKHSTANNKTFAFYL